MQSEGELLRISEKSVVGCLEDSFYNLRSMKDRIFSMSLGNILFITMTRSTISWYSDSMAAISSRKAVSTLLGNSTEQHVP